MERALINNKLFFVNQPEFFKLIPILEKVSESNTRI